MSLLGNQNRFIDVTDFGVRADPDATRGSAIVRPGGDGTNRQAFKDAIAALRALAPRRDLPAGAGTLYVPPGRYLIEVDVSVLDAWRRDLRGGLASGNGDLSFLRSISNTRGTSRFGQSLQFPEGTTLWLAPGAVLVPEHGCIVDISSLLVCEATECFDLSHNSGKPSRGLIIFGRGVPVVRPEWWAGVGETNASPAIQAAIDAAIHDRSLSAYSIAFNAHDNLVAADIANSRPPLVIELRGNYRLDSPLVVRGADTNNNILRQIVGGPTATLSVPGVFDTKTIIRGSFGGSRRQGAKLLAGDTGVNEPLLKLISTVGLTIENLGFASGRDVSGYKPCVELRASLGEVVELGNNRLEAGDHGIAFRSCRFEGSSTPLVQVGPPLDIEVRGSPTSPPRAAPSNWNSDFSMLSFDGCDFLVSSGGVAVDVRASQSLPVRFRRCEFSGQAAAMLSSWGGTQYLDGCRFDNAQPLDPVSTQPRGFELPDGSDIYLNAVWPSLHGANEYLWGTDFQTGLTAIGCVSRSRRFLSTVTPTYNNPQDQTWPVLLLNVRHTAPTARGAAAGPSVRWGMQHDRAVIVTGNRDDIRMGSGAPLVVIGGSFTGPIVLLRGAVQAAAVGSRVHIRDEEARVTPGAKLGPQSVPPAPSARTVVYGLRFDQRAARYQ